MNRKELKFKRTIKIISELAGLIVLGLTTALFLCSTAVTLCVHDTFTVDSRLFAQIDGEFKRREHPLSLQEESLSRPQYCEYFPELWFNGSLRYGPKCIKILQSVPGVRPQISPYFLEGCTNPLELVVFWAIISAMALQLTVLFVFICMRFDEIVRKNKKIYRENRKEGKYKVADSITSPENRTLEHTTTNGEILLHKNDLPGYHEIVSREY